MHKPLTFQRALGYEGVIPKKNPVLSQDFKKIGSGIELSRLFLEITINSLQENYSKLSFLSFGLITKVQYPWFGFFFVVILVIVFSRVKDGSLDNFGYNWIDQFFGKIFLPCNRAFCCSSLKYIIVDRY